MPYCTNCGEEVTAEQRYCSYCGEPVGDHQQSAARERQTSGESQPRESAGRSESPDRRREEATPSHSESAGRADDRRSGRGEAGRGGWQGEPPEQELVPRRGSFQTYYDGLRESVRLPAVLVLLGVAWGLTAAPTLFPPGAGFVVTLVSAVLGLLGAGIAYVATDDQYRDGETTAAEAARQTLDRALPLLGIWLVFIVAFSVGLFLFVIPGLYLGGRLLLAFPACVLDGEGVFESLSTSWELTSGDSLKPIGFLFGAFLTVIGISLVMAIPQGIVFSALDIGVSDAQTVDELVELASDPQFAAVNAVFTGLTMAVPIAAIQVAAAHMYLENRYGLHEKLL